MKKLILYWLIICLVFAFIIVPTDSVDNVSALTRRKGDVIFSEFFFESNQGEVINDTDLSYEMINVSLGYIEPGTIGTIGFTIDPGSKLNNVDYFILLYGTNQSPPIIDFDTTISIVDKVIVIDGCKMVLFNNFIMPECDYLKAYVIAVESCDSDNRLDYAKMITCGEANSRPIRCSKNYYYPNGWISNISEISSHNARIGFIMTDSGSCSSVYAWINVYEKLNNRLVDSLVGYQDITYKKDFEIDVEIKNLQRAKKYRIELILANYVGVFKTYKEFETIPENPKIYTLKSTNRYYTRIGGDSPDNIVVIKGRVEDTGGWGKYEVGFYWRDKFYKDNIYNIGEWKKVRLGIVDAIAYKEYSWEMPQRRASTYEYKFYAKPESKEFIGNTQYIVTLERSKPDIILVGTECFDDRVEVIFDINYMGSSKLLKPRCVYGRYTEITPLNQHNKENEGFGFIGEIYKQKFKGIITEKGQYRIIIKNNLDNLFPEVLLHEFGLDDIYPGFRYYIEVENEYGNTRTECDFFIRPAKEIPCKVKTYINKSDNIWLKHQIDAISIELVHSGYSKTYDLRLGIIEIGTGEYNEVLIKKGLIQDFWLFDFDSMDFWMWYVIRPVWEKSTMSYRRYHNGFRYVSPKSKIKIPLTVFDKPGKYRIFAIGINEMQEKENTKSYGNSIVVNISDNYKDSEVATKPIIRLTPLINTLRTDGIDLRLTVISYGGAENLYIDTKIVLGKYVIDGTGNYGGKESIGSRTNIASIDQSFFNKKRDGLWPEKIIHIEGRQSNKGYTFFAIAENDMDYWSNTFGHYIITKPAEYDIVDPDGINSFSTINTFESMFLNFRIEIAGSSSEIEFWVDCDLDPKYRRANMVNADKLRQSSKKVSICEFPSGVSLMVDNLLPGAPYRWIVKSKETLRSWGQKSSNKNWFGSMTCYLFGDNIVTSRHPIRFSKKPYIDFITSADALLNIEFEDVGTIINNSDMEVKITWTNVLDKEKNDSGWISVYDWRKNFSLEMKDLSNDSLYKIEIQIRKLAWYIDKSLLKCGVVDISEEIDSSSRIIFFRTLKK